MSMITALLGPTNTGKTHYAIERMLGHKSGMIGFPLRLLARENYDKIAKIKGRTKVALITGEEKIIPPDAQYFVCTVEAMPMDRDIDCMVIDEVQLAADPDRGHVFTDRILKARGLEETWLLGAATIKPVLQKLLPSARFDSRSRLSRLEFAGHKKLTRLPRRSAVVAFSTADVYSLAEMVRRHRGGAAVVMGALSPRTRNAQVEMYQSGEVDYLIATDAIGMGLNMDIDHVAFAKDSKFDGRFPRKLRPAEIGQIAGRAGRHMSDGTFGTTADCRPFDEELAVAVEEHAFDAVKQVFWRSTDLSFQTVRDLRRSLETPSGSELLIRTRDADDHRALEALSHDTKVMQRATSQARIRLLWDVCQIPDFQKTLVENHTRLLGEVYTYLTEGAERLPPDWVNGQMSRFDRVDGDIDTLAGRIAHIRTWTFITHRGDWISDPQHWQQRARNIEDRLSDALHERLTQRFVDRRAAMLARKLGEGDQELVAAVSNEGHVTVEGHHVGKLDGLTFVPDAANTTEARPVLSAARRVLPGEIARRIAQLEVDGDDHFAVSDRGRISWRGSELASLQAGDNAWTPKLKVHDSDLVETPQRDRIEGRIAKWFESHLEVTVPRLTQLTRAELDGGARGIVYQVLEGLGCASARPLGGLVRGLTEEQRKDLARVGLRLGTETIYSPDLLKPKAVAIRALLWSVANNNFPEEGPPPEGRVQVTRDEATPAEYDVALGYARMGGRTVRVDMVERMAALVRQAAREGQFAINADMLSLAGVDHETFGQMLLDLGYKKAGETDEGAPLFERKREAKPKRQSAPAGGGEEARKPPRKGGKPKGDRKPKERRDTVVASAKPKKQEYDPNSPFAVLASLKNKTPSS